MDVVCMGVCVYYHVARFTHTASMTTHPWQGGAVWDKYHDVEEAWLQELDVGWTYTQP
jgi:uncharacterized protein (DUF427 family)